MSDIPLLGTTLGLERPSQESSSHEYGTQRIQLTENSRARCRRVDNTLVLDIIWARWPGATAGGPVADHDFNIDDALSLLQSCGIKLRPSDVFDVDTDYAQMVVEQACDNWRHEYGGRPRSERPEELSSGASTVADTTVWRPSTRAKVTLDPSDKAGYTRVAVSRKEGTRAFTLFLPFTENSMSLDEEPVIYTEWPHDCKPTVSEKDFRLKFDQARGRTTLQARLRLRFCEHKENDRSARDPPRKLKALMLQRFKDVAGTHFQGASRDYTTLSGDQIRDKVKTCYQDLIETGTVVLGEFIRSDPLNGNLWTDIEIKGEHESPPSLDRLDRETLQGTKLASCDNFINLPWAYPTWYKIVTFPGTHAEITGTSPTHAAGGQSAGGLAPPAARRRLRSSTGAIDTTGREGG